MKTMVCISTQNQTVNLIPAILMQVERIIAISSQTAEKNHWTEHLRLVTARKGITFEKIPFVHKEDINPDILQKELEKSITAGLEDIIWNITGGKKSQIISMMKVYNDLCKDPCVVYLEYSPWKLMIYKGMQFFKEIDVEVDLHLEDILNLYGYTCITKHKSDQLRLIEDVISNNLDELEHLNQHFTQNQLFQEIFYKYAGSTLELEQKDREDISQFLSRILEKYKPQYRIISDTILPAREGYRNLHYAITEFQNVYKLHTSDEKYQTALRKLFKIVCGENIYQDYWEQVKKEILNFLISNLKNDSIPLLNKDLTPKQIEKIKFIFRQIGGEIKPTKEFRKNDIFRFAFQGSIGKLFELMVYYEFVQVKKQNRIRFKAYAGVKTYRFIAEDYNEHGQVKYPVSKSDKDADDEIDLVITTQHGTLLIFEFKTFGFSGDIIRSNRDTIITKSGPFGRVYFINNLLKSTLNEKGEYPDYVPQKIIAQVAASEKLGIKMWKFDEIRSEIPDILAEN